MNLERFTALIAAYGADARRWPATERAAAEALLAASSAAQALQREAQAFDDLMLTAALPELAPSAELQRRVLAQIGAPQPLRAGWRVQVGEALALLFPSGRAMPQFAALALALAIGIGAGVANVGLVDQQDTDLVSVQIAAAAPILYEE